MRTEPPLDGDERTVLVGWLDFHRETLAMKCDGLAPDDLARRPIAGSAMSLLGLVRHLAEIERSWFRRTFAGEPVDDLPFGVDPFESGVDDAATALATWRAEVEAARAVISRTLTLEDRGASGLPMRFWLVKTLNEYARHNGHADIVRELLDGSTGE
ncbi:MAG TPA: DinB family protein [Acidimicrobiales bacterium]|nr:DinB family protein [Acidimicrobiales bacterium]